MPVMTHAIKSKKISKRTHGRKAGSGEAAVTAAAAAVAAGDGGGRAEVSKYPGTKSHYEPPF